MSEQRFLCAVTPCRYLTIAKADDAGAAKITLHHEVGYGEVPDEDFVFTPLETRLLTEALCAKRGFARLGLGVLTIDIQGSDTQRSCILGFRSRGDFNVCKVKFISLADPDSPVKDIESFAAALSEINSHV